MAGGIDAFQETAQHQLGAANAGGGNDVQNLLRAL